MKAQEFRIQNVVNPETGAESQRIAVAFDNGKVIKLFNGDKTIEETKEEVLKDREGFLKKVVLMDGEFGPYCMFSKAETVDTF